MSIESVMPSNHLILCRPLLLCPQSFPASASFSMRQFLKITSGGQSIEAEDFGSSISPSNEYSGPISFRNHQFDFLAVQRTLKSLLQHHDLKASILQHSAFFMVQLSHPYMTTEKTIALTKGTFVGKVMSLLFNTLSSFIIAFHLRSKRLLILWLQSPSIVILESKKIKSATVFTLSPSICHEVMGQEAVILVF